MFTNQLRMVTGLVWLCAVCAIAVPPTGIDSTARAAEPAARPLAPGDVDTAESRVFVHVGKRRLGHEHGVEGLVKSGHLKLEATENAGEIVFDMQSFKADTDVARKHVGLESTTDAEEQTEVTQTMTGKGVLDVKQHPTATFTVDSSKPVEEKSADGHPQYELAGEFSLHGKKLPLTVTTAVVTEKDGKQHLSGQFTIKQTDYGIKPYSAVGGLVAVKDELKIFGELWIVK